MITNILLLLSANIFIPLVPIIPQVFITYCGYQYMTTQLTLYDDMNLTRLYTEQEFKSSFRDSLKRLHPDRGGTQQNFARVKSAKSIMQKPINYYDLYNMTNVDFSYNQQPKDVIAMKELLYYFETMAFYLIALLYFIAFTIDDKLRPLRKLLLPLTILFFGYEYFIHENPKLPTVFDLINGKIPIFVQSTLIKRIFCILTAVIRARAMRRKDQEMILLEQIKNLPAISLYQPESALSSANRLQSQQAKQQTQSKKKLYLQKLRGLLEIYAEKVKKMQAEKQSWGTKIRDWISKGFSFAIFGLMIWGAISSSMGGGTKYQGETMDF